jgi:FimV-like protein
VGAIKIYPQEAFMKKIITVLCFMVLGTGAVFCAQAASEQSYYSDAAQPAPVVAAPVSSDVGGAALLDENTSKTSEKTQSRLQNLEASTQAMSVAIEAINQNILVLQQQVAQLQPTHEKTHKAHHTLFIYGGVLLIVIVLLLGILMGRLSRSRAAKSVTVVQHAHRAKDTRDQATGVLKNEYDFMGTAEAIPAQLDLARSYIAMGDKVLAKKALQIVLSQGNAAQCREAESLLETINQHD